VKRAERTFQQQPSCASDGEFKMHPSAVSAAFTVVAAAIFLLTPLSVHGQGTPADHRAHAVPDRGEVVIFDLDGDGAQNYMLDGTKSHSHYFSPGPPVINGKIVSYSWADKSGQVVCKLVSCVVAFPVGVTTLNLTVVDNTNDVASAPMVITVKPSSEATGKPVISTLEPGSGSISGGQSVTLKGDNLYEGLIVKFGAKPATNVVWQDLNTAIVKSPASAAGTVNVTVSTGQGVSEGKMFTYEGGAFGAVKFKAANWQKQDGTPFTDAQQVTSITIGPDGRYFLGTLTGLVHAVKVGKDLKVQSACSGAQLPSNRAIHGIAWNPADKKNRLLVTTNTQYWKAKGGVWYNGAVEFVNIEPAGSSKCVTRGETLISGLPVSNHDHGVNRISFIDGGANMLISIGGTTNAGVSNPGDKLGGVLESPLSGAIVLASSYLSAGFDGNIKYDQVNDPGTANVVSGDVSVYAPGLRNSFGLLADPLSGRIYATDNGANDGFGVASTSCTTAGENAQDGDSLFLIGKGNYYGHPNRNRGRNDARQCVYKGKDSQATLAKLRSSTNGIMSYTANTFGGKLKGSLILTRFAFDGPGETFRVELDGNGKVAAGPYVIWDDSGLSVIQGQFGELVMPQLKNQNVLVLLPDDGTGGASTGGAGVATSGRMSGDQDGHVVSSIQPMFGSTHGGTDLHIYGRNFEVGATVRVGGAECGNVRYVSSNSLSCTTPAGTLGHRHSITVTLNGLTSIAYGADFVYTADV
jgi:glucose/arabinose dehydrogenase